MTNKSGQGFRRYVMLAMLVVLLDQLSKLWIVNNLQFHGALPVLPFFSIVHARNYGAAFGILNEAGGMQTVVFAGIAIFVSAVLMIWLRRVAERQRQLSLALALVLGGAIGNLVDRIHYQYVVDMILVFYRDWYFPAFNLADAAISIGAVLLLLDGVGWKLIHDRPLPDNAQGNP